MLRPKIIKPEEHKRESFITLLSAMMFLDMIPKAQVMKAKIDNIKLNSFCTAKKTINRIKGNQQNGRKYLQIIFLVRG